jgi:glycine betaine transporter
VRAPAPRDARIVVILSFLLVLAFGVCGLIAPDGTTSASVGRVNFVLDSVGRRHLTLCTGFIVLAAALALGPYGKVRVGPDDSCPEVSTASWLAMLFAGGMGAGLVVWGVAGPVAHFAHPPGSADGHTAESARLSMVMTNLHPGLHAWSIFDACGLVLAYFIFHRGMPGMISTPMRATLPAFSFRL